jgi:phosphonate transport system substrate-binding protein
MAGGKAATRGWPARLVLGLITPRDPEQMLKAWTPFADRLGKSLGVPVECRMYKVTAELVEDFRRGLVDFAFVGNLPALELVESGNAAVFAQLVVKGQHGFRSLLVTHKDSPIRGIADVSSGSRRWVFGDGDVKSTSGHVVPRYYAFIKRGINEPEGLFREVRRGSHLENMMRAAAKEVDVATTNTTELSLLREARPEVANELRVVWESPDIPESPLVWSTALPASLRQKMQDFTIAFGQRDAREKEILTGINNLTGFRKSNNAQLTMIADMEMFNARQRIMNDGKLSAEERSAKVEEVIRRGTKLELQLKLGRPA